MKSSEIIKTYSFVMNKYKQITERKDVISKVIISNQICTFFGRTYYRVYIDIDYTYAAEFYEQHADTYVGIELKNSHNQDSDELGKAIDLLDDMLCGLFDCLFEGKNGITIDDRREDIKYETLRRYPAMA
jgi:hypothetical protein